MDFLHRNFQEFAWKKISYKKSANSGSWTRVICGQML